MTRPPWSACTSFSIFIASTMQTTWPASISSPSETETARTVPCIGETIVSWVPEGRVGVLPAPAAAGELAPGRLGLECAQLGAATVELDDAHGFDQARTCRRRAPVCSGATLLPALPTRGAPRTSRLR